MFTGIVEGVGKVEKISKNTKNRSDIQMTVNLGKHAKGLKIGQSMPYSNQTFQILLYF